MALARHVLFFGDSFVAGIGDPTGLGWVGRVVAASYGAGCPTIAYNLGVRRDTSADVSRRWRAEADVRMGYAGVSQAVVFSFGVNDATAENGGVRVAPDLSVQALQTLVTDATSIGLDVFVVGPPPAGDAAQDKRVRELSSRFAGLCSGLGTPFVETFGPLAGDPHWAGEALENDGAHPGARGYAALSELVLAGGWLEWLRRTSTASGAPSV
jgi:lysophospholipase L1-like esterase